MIKKLRSATYPRQNFENTIKFARKIDENFSSRIVSYSEVVKMLLVKSYRSPTFSKNVSTAKQFGLISVQSGTIQLTDLAMHILHPTKNNIGDLESKALLNSALYSKLIEHFRDDDLPTQETLANILLNDYNIINSVKYKAAQYFLESIEQVGMEQNGRISTMSGDAKITSENNIGKTVSEFESPNILKTTNRNNVDETEYYRIIFPISTSRVLLEIPQKILNDKKQIQLIKSIIDANLSILSN